MLAIRSDKLVMHPNKHMSRGQSSSNMFPMVRAGGVLACQQTVCTLNQVSSMATRFFLLTYTSNKCVFLLTYTSIECVLVCTCAAYLQGVPVQSLMCSHSPFCWRPVCCSQ